MVYVTSLYLPKENLKGQLTGSSAWWLYHSILCLDEVNPSSSFHERGFCISRDTVSSWALSHMPASSVGAEALNHQGNRLG